MIFRRSPDVPALDDYRAYRDPYLRPDFQYRCAYCLTHEYYFLGGEAGQIDHYRPLHPPAALGKDFSTLANVYDNLYWSCPRCNLYKGNRWPTDAEYDRGERFLDPCAEDHDAHWDTRPGGTVVARTPTGRYTIRVLRLDRPRLNARRVPSGPADARPHPRRVGAGGARQPTARRFSIIWKTCASGSTRPAPQAVREADLDSFSPPGMTLRGGR